MHIYIYCHSHASVLFLVFSFVSYIHFYFFFLHTFTLGVDREDEPFLVMEYMSAGSVQDLLYSSPVPIVVEERLKWILEAAKGMRFLHSQSPPFVHRGT